MLLAMQLTVFCDEPDCTNGVIVADLMTGRDVDAFHKAAIGELVRDGWTFPTEHDEMTNCPQCSRGPRDQKLHVTTISRTLEKHSVNAANIPF